MSLVSRTILAPLLSLLCSCTTGGACAGSRALSQPNTERAATAPSRTRSSAARHDLGMLPVELGEANWPASPRIEREIVVEGGRPQVASGTRYLVRANLDRLLIDADDVEVRVDRGIRVGQLVIERARRRIRLVGGRYGAIELAIPAQHHPPPPTWRREWMVEDVSIENVEVEAEDTAFAIRGRRIAIVDSKARARRYAVWCGDTADFQTEDLILARNRFEAAGPESTVRLVGVRGAIVVDNVLSNGEKHDFRVHGESDRVFFARNRLLHTGIMVGSMPEDHVGSVWIVDNVLHHRVPSLFQIEPSRVQRLVARGNRVYSDRWSCFVCTTARAGWELSDNRIAPYRAPD